MRRVPIRGTQLAFMVALGLTATTARAQPSCSYSISPTIDFGTVTGLPTPQIDVTATVSVTCSSLLNINHRVCVSLPPGSAGNTLDDRRLVNGSDSVHYQLYTDSSRTTVWGELGGNHPPVAFDFPLLIGERTVEQTIYARLFSGQAGLSVGTYLSSLVPVARRDNYLLIPPSCQQITANATSLPALPVQLVVEPACTIAAAPLDFGTVTGIVGHTATSNLSVQCTADAPYSIALDGGTVTGDVNDRRMQLVSGSDTIEYQLYQDGGHTQIWGETPGTMVDGTGTGGPQSIPIFGLVPAQGPKPSGGYDDTVTATVVY